jgi:MFS family permease
VPAALVAPFAAGAADRYRPARVLAAGYVLQALTFGLTAAALLLNADPLVAYAFAALAATAVTLTRPTQAALAPSLARTPDELTATNVITGWIESISVLVAPAAAGVLLAVGEPGTVFAAAAVVMVASLLLVLSIAGPPAQQRSQASGSPFHEALAGLRIVRAEPEPRLLVLLLSAQFVAVGALDVLYVVLAIDVLGQGESWAGYLNAAFGAGGVLGVVATAMLVGRRHLAPAVLAGAAVWFAAFVALAVSPEIASALILLGVAGAGRLLLDVAGRTLLQRAGPPEFLSRVFGVLEGLTMAALAVGAMLTPLLVALTGARGAIVGVGVVLPLAVLLMSRRLLEIDAERTVPVVEIALLRSLPLFAPLPPPELDGLARSLEPLHVVRGRVVLREGEPGDRFYAIGDGKFEVAAAGVVLAELSRGDAFGEIALLRDVPRTATVTARTDGLLYALEKAAFLIALTGHADAARAADRLADDRLRERASRIGSRP